MKKILCVYGTRPEIIKMVSVIEALKGRPDVECRVLNTGQHRGMVEALERMFGLEPDYRFDIMRGNQSINQIVAAVVAEFGGLLREYRPDVVVVQGDTSTVFSVAVAAFNEGIEVAHVEAGLRSFDIRSPFPEEFNRRAVSLVATYNFPPTERAAENLKNEGVPDSMIWVTGNTVIDAIRLIEGRGELDDVNGADGRNILVTAHRRESFGDGIRNICQAVRQVAEHYADVRFVWPVHPNPNVSDVVRAELSGVDRVELCEPLDYLALLSAMRSSYMIWSDSGGIQEESPTFAKPILILRDVTERPEVVESGHGLLVGTDVGKIVIEAERLLTDGSIYAKRTEGANPFGDGCAGRKIAEVLA